MEKLSPTHSAAKSLWIPGVLAVGLSVAIMVQGGFGRTEVSANIAPETILVPAVTFTYRTDGEFFKGNLAVDAPLETVRAPELNIMKFQVSVGDYLQCVHAGACKETEAKQTNPMLPQVGVNFTDANSYAAWISEATGEIWRLPTDRELAQAAGEKFPDDALNLDEDDFNPALRWIASYEQETASKNKRNAEPQALGAFGENEIGLSDFGGNVWEWTTTCHRRVKLFKSGLQESSENICGIYSTVGPHRSPMSDFVRDPKGGGCAVGTPPDNLGFRLVKDDSWASQFASWIG